MLKGSNRARDARYHHEHLSTCEVLWRASCGACVGQRTTKIVQAAAFEIADNALTRAFVELAGFDPRLPRCERCV